MIILITLSSERGIRREPSLLPDDYCGGVVDEDASEDGSSSFGGSRFEMSSPSSAKRAMVFPTFTFLVPSGA